MSLAFDYTNSKSIPISIQPSKNYDGKKKKKRKSGEGGETPQKLLILPSRLHRLSQSLHF